MKIAMAILSVMALASCASTESGSRLRTYKMTVQHVKMADDTYRVYDHKTDNSLLVSPSMGKIMTMGVAQGATLGLADTMTPQQKLEAAGNQHLANTGRADCKIVRGSLLQKPLYEFWFECETT